MRNTFAAIKLALLLSLGSLPAFSTVPLYATDLVEPLGEGLRKQIEGQYCLFEKIRERLPNLIIENCSSGGHRLEPSMLARTAMSSFSDAHELVEIPIIAANLHRLMLPRQSQIWAVLHKADSDQRLAYSLAATFLGRMALSGEIAKLSDAQWALVQCAMKLYRQAAPIIKHGTSRRFGELGASWRHPQGWQAVVRAAADKKSALVVLHTFADTPKQVTIPLPKSRRWKIAGQFGGAKKMKAELAASRLKISTGGDFCGQIFLLSHAT